MMGGVSIRWRSLAHPAILVGGMGVGKTGDRRAARDSAIATGDDDR
jgi:hypothetical protein